MMKQIKNDEWLEMDGWDLNWDFMGKIWKNECIL